MTYQARTTSPDLGSFRSSRSSFTLGRDSQLLSSPSLDVGSLYSPHTVPRERGDPAVGLARARLELASTTRANAQILELRTALADKQRKERRHAAEVAQVREDLKQLITLLSGRDETLERIDAALDRTQHNFTAREESMADLRLELEETRTRLEEASENHHVQLSRLRQQHETRLRQIMDQHEAELMLGQQQFNDLRFELEARDEQLDSLRHALDAMTSPRAPPVTFLHATPSPCSIFSLPATPAEMSPSGHLSAPVDDTAGRLATLEAQNAALAQSLAMKEDEYHGLVADMLSLREQLQGMQMSHVELLSTKDAEIARLQRHITDLGASDGTRTEHSEQIAADRGPEKRATSSSRMRQPSLTPKTPHAATFGSQSKSLRTRSTSNSAPGMVSSKSAGALSAARPTLHALSSQADTLPRETLPSSTSVPMLTSTRMKASSALRTRTDTVTAGTLKPSANLKVSLPTTRRKTSASVSSKLDPSAIISSRRPSTSALVPRSRDRVPSSGAVSIASDSSALTNVTNNVDLKASASSKTSLTNLTGA